VTPFVIAAITVAVLVLAVVTHQYYRMSASSRRCAKIELQGLQAQQRLRYLTEHTLLAMRREVRRHGRDHDG
jgi:hypothetical protein